MRRKIFYYNPRLKKYARELRNNSTKSEIILWQYLKGKRIEGYDFHRQKPIDEYIVDFFCNELALAIEIDGATHDWKVDYDEFRQKNIENYGISFLRFPDNEIFFNIDGVLVIIQEWIRNNQNNHG